MYLRFTYSQHDGNALPQIEIFKTNVTDKKLASRIIDKFHETFCEYSANFDLHDCDNILRIKSTKGEIQVNAVVEFMKRSGFDAEPLPG